METLSLRICSLFCSSLLTTASCSSFTPSCREGGGREEGERKEGGTVGGKGEEKGIEGESH